jgi:hypothetical protein
LPAAEHPEIPTVSTSRLAERAQLVLIHLNAEGVGMAVSVAASTRG